MFAVGDVVVCVAGCESEGQWERQGLPDGPAVGDILRVSGVDYDPSHEEPWGLLFAKYPTPFGWAGSCFRKIRKADTDIFALADRRLPVGEDA